MFMLVSNCLDGSVTTEEGEFMFPVYGGLWRVVYYGCV
jgi:hypothetical protein